ncbi:MULTISPECIES: DUF2852 domain-containing protein [unclassified Yoonia]|uniref:DUF2852 domain-containing protein n=1 Tax=unclassified Yoonia TaxID=2629118 RepID=UPI002AFEFE8E|nr:MULTISPECIES: DUF2852 domain-containing protein [unclassified Yoonia]
MMTTNTALNYDTRPGFFARTEAWLDARGKGAWIAAMVLGFIVFWPIGLAILAYMLWGKGMFARTSCKKSDWSMPMTKSSGNAAFDAYRDETIRRLEDEQHKFEAFLKRLRDAKDKAEFDAFMNDRESKAAAKTDLTPDAPQV